LQTLSLPCANVTKAAFRGATISKLSTSPRAHHARRRAQRREQPLAGGLFRVRVDVTGVATRNRVAWPLIATRKSSRAVVSDRRDWFDDPKHLDMVALYLERFMNYGLTANELLSGRPIIGIAQTGGRSHAL
jgi:hypothetical protein